MASIYKTLENKKSQGTLGGYSLGRTTDYSTSQGLYNLATQSGLQKDADRILASQQGEDTKKIFSGGFISDIFDTLNALQYGVVGTLKGKSFMDGVQTRQSWSDKDALGNFGLPGLVGGIALDIACDPLTYIAPMTIAEKIPGFTKLVKGAKEFAFGKMVEKTIETAGEGAKTFETLEGGTKIGKWFAEKFVYNFGKDPIYAEAYNKSIKNIAVGTKNIVDMSRGLADFSNETASKLLTKDETGRFMRVGLDELEKVLNPEEFGKVKVAWNKIDELGKEAVDLGLLSQGKFEENYGEYIKNAYTEYELAKKKGVFGFMKTGVKGIKKRVVGLTPEVMKELGQIDKPAYLVFKSAFDLTKDVENAKLFKLVGEKFGSDIAQEGFKQLPETQRLITTMGKQTDILSGIKKVNQDLKPAFKGLEETFKGDKTILSLIKNTEKQLGELGSKRVEELTKFFQEGQKTTKEIVQKGIKTGLPLVEKLPKELFDIAQNIKTGKVYDKLELEKLFEEGLLERNGFKSIKGFIDYVKKPAEIIPSKIIETTTVGNIPKIIELQKNIEKLSIKAEGFKNIDKRSIDDAYRFFEDTINTLTGKKENLIEQLGKVKLGDLSGKFVPENIFNAIQDITTPEKVSQIVANFKYMKVVLNPATHARNMVSNSILNWWKLGIGPWNLNKYADSIKDIATNGEWWQRVQKVGGGMDTMASNEIMGILETPDAFDIGNKLSKNWKNIRNKIGSIYQGEENVAKLTAFKEMIGRGLTDEDAWKAAESATFNYAQVTPFVRKLRTALWGFPFITFTVKSTPIVVETALKAPGKISVFGKIKTAIENQSDIKETAREKASEPGYIRDGFYIKLPMKDKNGNSAYFDLTYIIPFGDLMAGNFFERQTSRETGLPESVPSAAMSKAPLFNAIKEISHNQDFYGDKIWNESDSIEKQLGDLMRYLTKTYLPPLVADQIPGGYKSDGTRRQKGIIQALSPQEKATQSRTLMEELLRNVGAKIQPIDADIQETYQEWNKQKSLQTLLLEKGLGANFQRFYVPK